MAFVAPISATILSAGLIYGLYQYLQTSPPSVTMVPINQLSPDVIKELELELSKKSDETQMLKADSDSNEDDDLGFNHVPLSLTSSLDSNDQRIPMSQMEQFLLEIKTFSLNRLRPTKLGSKSNINLGDIPLVEIKRGLSTLKQKRNKQVTIKLPVDTNDAMLSSAYDRIKSQSDHIKIA